MKKVLLTIVLIILIGCSNEFRSTKLIEHYKTIKKPEMQLLIKENLSSAEQILFKENGKLIIKNEGVFEITKYSINEILDYKK